MKNHLKDSNSSEVSPGNTALATSLTSVVLCALKTQLLAARGSESNQCQSLASLGKQFLKMLEEALTVVLTSSTRSLSQSAEAPKTSSEIFKDIHI